MARPQVFRVLPLLLLALATAACEKQEGIFDRLDGMVADQPLPELLELGVQRRAKLDEAITAALEKY